jgi:hypothetical protein
MPHQRQRDRRDGHHAGHAARPKHFRRQDVEAVTKMVSSVDEEAGGIDEGSAPTDPSTDR